LPVVKAQKRNRPEMGFQVLKGHSEVVVVVAVVVVQWLASKMVVSRQ